MARGATTSFFGGLLAETSPAELVALTLAGALGDAGSGIGASAARAGWARARPLLAGPDSNHRLLELIRQVKWAAALQVFNEMEQASQAGIPPELEQIGRFLKQAQEEKLPALDARSETERPRPSRASHKVREAVAGFFRSLSRKDGDSIGFSPADRALLQRLEDFIARESHNQSSGTATEPLQEVGDLLCEAVLQEIWAREFAGPKKGPHRFREKPRETGVPEFVDRFCDPDFGFVPTFRVLLKGRLEDPKADRELRRIMLALTGEIRRLVYRLDERIGTLQAYAEKHDRDLQRLLNIVRPPLTLKLYDLIDPGIGGEAVTFTNYVYTGRATEFLGREQELEALRRFLDAEDETMPLRWWQVSGAGGQGKSRLALHIAEAYARTKGWHAGFLDLASLEETSWSTVPIERPTLCIIDYVSAPRKAQQLGRALNQLHNRLNGDHRLQVPVRFLLLDRVGYGEEREVGGLSPAWEAMIATKSEDRIEIEALRWEKSSLHLDTPADEMLVAIANSWRTREERLPPLTADEEKKLLDMLKSGQAQRPLFAMMFADHLDATAGREEILSKVLKEERQTLWRNAENQPHIPPPEAENLACLATITGGVTFDDPLLDNRRDRYAPQNGIQPVDHVADAFMTVGYNVPRNLRSDELPGTLPPRQPDLLGQWMVLEMLAPCVASGALGQDPQRLVDLMQDAWTLNASEAVGFLVRLQEDFPRHPVTRALCAVDPGPDAFPADRRSFALNFAAYVGNVSLTERIIATAVDIDKIHGLTGAFPLLMAAQNGHAAVVELLLKEHAKVDKIDETDGTFPLLMAAQNGHAAVVELLLKEHAEVDKIHGTDGAFPLLLAAKNGHAAVVDLLLKEHAEVDRVNETSGAFPLLMAAAMGHADVVELLLKEHAEVDKIHEPTGTFPLLMAAQEGHAAVVELLLKEHAEVDKIDETDGTFPLLMAAQEGHAAVVDLLLKEHAEVDKIHETSGAFPLLMAAQNGHADVVELLLEKSAKVDRVHEQTGLTPLMAAVQAGHADVVALLRARGAQDQSR